MIGEYLQEYTFQNLITKALATVPDTIDKREGSIIYDAIAPACMALAEFYGNLYRMVVETYVLTASGEYLDNRVIERGIRRYAATLALRRADFVTRSGQPMAIPLSSRFSTIDETNAILYRAISAYTDESGAVVPGAYVLECETPGTHGNDYIGPLLPITYIQGLATATMTSIVRPARGNESDDELRQRYIEEVDVVPFGGNIAQYRREVKAIEGVGDLQVYPVWDGGGTVRLSIIDAQYNPISSDFISILQELIDPENAEGVRGTGLGMAPIGHKVSIVTPNIVAIDLSATITLKSGYTLQQVQPLVEENIRDYLVELRKSWSTPDQYNNYEIYVFYAQIVSRILLAAGVANVTNLTINGGTLDISLEQTALNQEIPAIGTVTLQ